MKNELNELRKRYKLSPTEILKDISLWKDIVENEQQTKIHRLYNCKPLQDYIIELKYDVETEQGISEDEENILKESVWGIIYKMTRRVQLNINYANQSKQSDLDLLVKEMCSVINCFIDILWEQKNFSSKYVDFKVPSETWLSARAQQCCGKQALEIVKSQRRKKKKTKRKQNLCLKTSLSTLIADSLK